VGQNSTGVDSYVINHYNNATIFNMFHVFEMSRNDVVMTVFPMYGRVGFAWVAASVLYGCRNVITNFKPMDTLELVAHERVTIVNLVATMAGMLLQQPELEATDVRSLRAVVFAGSLLPAPIREGTIARLCPDLYEYYGMQETAALVASTPQDRVRRPGSVGKPILFAQIRIVDGGWHEVPTGQSGAILGRSPGGVTAYYKNPEKSAETFRNGWINTGDVGYVDNEGYLFISGRLKDVIVTGGQNVHAGEVEATILQLPEVAGCAVIGLPDALWGERVAAVVVPRGESMVSPDAVIAWCHEHLAGFKAPKQVFVQSEPLPITPTGKVRKFMLVERYGGVPGGNVVDTEK
jgi:acyl-CoA synthetase (AMP-forming)/AMP-acid ligase II